MALFSKKKYLKLAKGFFGRTKNCISIAIPKVEKSLQHAYRGRKLKQRTLREEWISTVNAGLTEHAIRYSTFINALNFSNLKLDRKILAELAMNQPFTFKALVDEVKVQAGLTNEKPKYSLLDGYKQGWIIDTDEIRAEDFDMRPKPINLRVVNPKQQELREYTKKVNERLGLKGQPKAK